MTAGVHDESCSPHLVSQLSEAKGGGEMFA